MLTYMPVTQSKFVPLNATAIILVNAITGVIIWQDWRVISSWTGYICVFLLLALGCDLLLSSSNLLTNENAEYGVKKRASIIIESTPLREFQLARSFGTRNLYADIGANTGGTTTHNYLSRAVSDISQKENRREAWKSLFSTPESDVIT